MKLLLIFMVTGLSSCKEAFLAKKFVKQEVSPSGQEVVNRSGMSDQDIKDFSYENQEFQGVAYELKDDVKNEEIKQALKLANDLQEANLRYRNCMFDQIGAGDNSRAKQCTRNSSEFKIVSSFRSLKVLKAIEKISKNKIYKMNFSFKRQQVEVSDPLSGKIFANGKLDRQIDGTRIYGGNVFEFADMVDFTEQSRDRRRILNKQGKTPEAKKTFEVRGRMNLSAGKFIKYKLNNMTASPFPYEKINFPQSQVWRGMAYKLRDDPKIKENHILNVAKKAQSVKDAQVALRECMKKYKGACPNFLKLYKEIENTKRILVDALLGKGDVAIIDDQTKEKLAIAEHVIDVTFNFKNSTYTIADSDTGKELGVLKDVNRKEIHETNISGSPSSPNQAWFIREISVDRELIPHKEDIEEVVDAPLRIIFSNAGSELVLMGGISNILGDLNI